MQIAIYYSALLALAISLLFTPILLRISRKKNSNKKPDVKEKLENPLDNFQTNFLIIKKIAKYIRNS